MFDMLLEPDRLMTFFLVVIRLAGLLFTAPVYGSFVIDPRLRILFTVFLAMVMMSAVPVIPIAGVNTVLLVLIILKELLIGIAAGLLAQFLFIGVQFGAQIIGFQMGFGVVNVLDPQTGASISIIAQFQNIIMIIVFLTVGGHRLVIRAIHSSFETIPLGVFTIPPEAWSFLVGLFSTVFVVAIKIVAPIFVSLLLTHVTMGIMARLVPQLNVLIVGFPIQIAVGLSVLAFSMSYFYIVFEKIMHQYFRNLLQLFMIFGQG